MASWSNRQPVRADDSPSAAGLFPDGASYAEAEAVLQNLASVFLENTTLLSGGGHFSLKLQRQDSEYPLPNLEAKYRALVEQIPAVVFMAYLDEAVGEAYVSPQIEAVLGTQEISRQHIARQQPLAQRKRIHLLHGKRKLHQRARWPNHQ